MTRVQFFCLLAAALAACGAETAAPAPTPTAPNGVSHGKFSVGGISRSYRLFVPSNIDRSQPAPLVFALHACPSSADSAGGSATDDWATAGKFVLALPDGSNGCWNAGSCCSGADDVAFLSQLTDRLEAELRIDRTRVFVAGVSNGAAMAYRLACELSTKITAIASVSGALLVSTCQPSRQVSVLVMHGTTDDVYPIEGGGQYHIPPLLAVVQQWVTLDGCTGEPQVTVTGITKTSDWASCKAGTSVRSEVIIGAPHGWFGSEPNPLPGEPDAFSTVWSFFSTLHSP